MIIDQLTRWATTHPLYALAAALLVLVVLAVTVWRATRTLTLPVAAATIGALVCTAYSADTSWRFAGSHLGMVDGTERVIMFAAGEVALLACAIMARATKRATATEGDAGSPGTPGILVWVITGVQVVACYSTSGLVGGTVRAVIGPVMAGLLWHLAMGLEIRVARPAALSTGLLALIGRELRERLLSYLGLATRDRTAAQITRDRATARAVRLASRKLRTPFGRHRLAAAVARSGAATDPEQRDRLMHQLAARRSAEQLHTVAITSPWEAPVATTVERVALPDTEVPALPAAAPTPVVPDGTRLLSVLCRRSIRPAAHPAPTPTPVVPDGARLLRVLCRRSIRPTTPAFAAAVTRTVVRADYLPDVEVAEVAPADEVLGQDDDEVPEGDRDVPDPDPLIEQARRDFGTEVPGGVARLKVTYGIGQARAQRIRDALGGKK
ncbi:hypothetical protein [Streptomyces sp. NPDC051657]|uniref:hypothetical protein n=1 Tax=unclassified Streptomyces TaxID=2593676 RepID=UPI0034224691